MQFEKDADGLPTEAFLESLDTAEKWRHFLDTADEHSALHGFIYLNNLAYGELKEAVPSRRAPRKR